ncbi:MerR family transcriptional regulator [Pseudonocardia sp. HH130630-07]|uniref:MerR family transcriptional regulator n=1 Tax=Pseudonocardia sp. HH130630-07 TaxID=1690815 RepID=UPI000814D2CD|nr:MerR family transcriptional regulator [Pseudonocardia sp. HH130630-07]ANY10446.1 MerR family transcriptional regulator [Pseudonocardia sp. HH130630-07]
MEGWSTRELSELAGTSLRAVRHYHEIGLLPEPDRRANGYKQYGIRHLVRILRIKRLTELGFSLSRIATMIDDDDPTDALKSLDSELASTIERLQRARGELADILERSVPADVPTQLAPLPEADGLTKADHSLVVVKSRFLEPYGLDHYGDHLQEMRSDPCAADFDALPAKADLDTRLDLAERMAPHVRKLYGPQPELGPVGYAPPRQRQAMMTALRAALQEFYNPAQNDVMRRIDGIIRRSA